MPSNPNSPQVQAVIRIEANPPPSSTPPSTPSSSDPPPPIHLEDNVLHHALEATVHVATEEAHANISNTSKVNAAHVPTLANIPASALLAPNPSPSPDPPTPYNMNIQESVLKDVLEQLDKERSKRAEVESELFNVRKKMEQGQKINNHDGTRSTAATIRPVIKHNHNQDNHDNKNDNNDSRSVEEEETGDRLIFFDEADRRNKVNTLLMEYSLPTEHGKDSKLKKTTKRNVMASLTALYTEIYDTIMMDTTDHYHHHQDNSSSTTAIISTNSSSSSSTRTRIISDSTNNNNLQRKNSKDYTKERDLHIKDEVSKFISQYQKRSPNPYVFQYYENIIKILLNERLKDFIETLERLNSQEKQQEMKLYVEHMRMELISLRTERDGLLELLTALTPNNQALEYACCKDKVDNNDHDHAALPLEIVQMLEIIPWDDRVRSYTNKVDVVYQWQTYDVKGKQWIDKHNLFADESVSDKYNPSIPSSSSLAKTDEKIVDLTHGYALPKEGTWEWIGTWQLEGIPHLSANNAENTDKGWTYATNPVHIKSNIPGKCFEKACEEEENEKGDQESGESPQKKNQIPTRKYRRRIWKRQRVMISYPGVSRSTRHILDLGSQNAKLSLSVQKLHDQVFQMQNKLMQKEEDMDKTSTQLMEQISILELELRKKTKECDELKLKIPSTPSNSSQTGDKRYNLFESPMKSWGSRDGITPDRSISSLFKFSGSFVDASADISMKLKGESPTKSRSKSPEKNEKQYEEKTVYDKNPSQSKDQPKESPNDPVIESSKEPPPKESPSKNKRSKPPLITSNEIDIDDGNPFEQNEETETKNDNSVEQEPITTSFKRKDTAETIFEDDSLIVSTDYVKPAEEEEEEEVEEVEVTVDEKQKTGEEEEQVISNKKEEENITPIVREKTGIDMKVISVGSIFNKVTSKVKDVEHNVNNVKHSVQAIAERARSLQKIASHLPVK